MYFVTGYGNNEVIFFTSYNDKRLAEERKSSLEQSGFSAVCKYKANPASKDFLLQRELFERSFADASTERTIRI